MNNIPAIIIIIAVLTILVAAVISTWEEHLQAALLDVVVPDPDQGVVELGIDAFNVLTKQIRARKTLF